MRPCYPALGLLLAAGFESAFAAGSAAGLSSFFASSFPADSFSP
jgi:hypothetical protein